MLDLQERGASWGRPAGRPCHFSRPPSKGCVCPRPLFPEGHSCHVYVWRDPLVGSGFLRWMNHATSSGTTSVPLRRFGGTCLSGPFFSEGRACQVHISGGTCLSRPPFNVGLSISFHRGLKSRTLWSAAIHRRFIVKALAFTTLALAVFCHDHESALVGAIHELPLQRRRDPLVRSAV
jgi:hypothetical protein